MRFDVRVEFGHVCTHLSRENISSRSRPLPKLRSNVQMMRECFDECRSSSFHLSDKKRVPP